MTRRTLLASLTAAIAGKESLQASSVDLQEIPVDSSKLYVLHIDSEISDANREALQKAWFGVFAPEKAPKLVVVDGEGARLSIAQPLGADDIEAAVERGIARAMKIEPAGIQGTTDDVTSSTGEEFIPTLLSPSAAYEIRRRELLPFGLCHKCQDEPAFEAWTHLCRKCDPEGAAKSDRRNAVNAYHQERKLAKEREWLAKQPRFDHFGNDWTNGNPALSTSSRGAYTVTKV